jgi:hypothetical protein
LAGWWPSILQGVLIIGQLIVSESKIPNWLFIISGVAISWKFIAYGRGLQKVKKGIAGNKKRIRTTYTIPI